VPVPHGMTYPTFAAGSVTAGSAETGCVFNVVTARSKATTSTSNADGRCHPVTSYIWSGNRFLRRRSCSFTKASGWLMAGSMRFCSNRPPGWADGTT
jgi:hypothetical protein